jgi:hypothetical protein
MRLNEQAKEVLRGYGIPQAEWARANYMPDGKWNGDACGCPDDRCKDGYHHYPADECECLQTLVDLYLKDPTYFAEGAKRGLRAAIR